MVCCDWLSVVWKIERLPWRAKLPEVQLWDDIEHIFKDFPGLLRYMRSRNCEFRAEKRNFYDMACFIDESTQFCLLAHSHKEDMGICLNVPGSAMYLLASLVSDTAIPAVEVESCKIDASPIIRKLVESGGRVSRIDICYDDYAKRFTPRQLAGYYLEGKICSPASYCKLIASRQSGSDTFYLGKRSAERMLRVYDKNAESDGEINAIRWEFQFRKDKANYVAMSIADSGEFSFQAELLGDSEHVGFMKIKKFGISNDLKPGDERYNAEHVARSQSDDFKEYIDFVKHEIKIPETETVYIKPEKKSTVKGKIRNFCNNRIGSLRLAAAIEKAGEIEEFDLYLAETAENYAALLASSQEERKIVFDMASDLMLSPGLRKYLRE